MTRNATSSLSDAGACQQRNNTNRDCARNEDCPISEYCNLATGQCVECLNDDQCDAPEVCSGAGTCGADNGA